MTAKNDSKNDPKKELDSFEIFLKKLEKAGQNATLTPKLIKEIWENDL